MSDDGGTMSAKTEACWDRTEGCCMTDAARLPVVEVEWYRAVSKHEHMSHPPRTYPCDKPWTALCQSDPQCRICWFEDFATQPEATAALDRHIRENDCDPTRDRGNEPPACKQVAS